MRAFVQRLSCGHHVYVRAGPLAEEYGDPWKWGCLGEIEGESVTLFGYSKFNNPPLEHGVLNAMIAALQAEGFKEVNLGRQGSHPHRLIFTQGDDGVTHMSAIAKKAIPNVSTMFKSDGTLSDDAIPTFLHVFMQHAAGHIEFSGGKATQTDIGGGKTKIDISFIRQG